MDNNMDSSHFDPLSLKRLTIKPNWNPKRRLFEEFQDETIQLFLPIDMWISNAVSFGQLGANRFTNYQAAIMTMIELFAQTALLGFSGVGKYVRFAFERVMHRDHPDQTVGMQMRLTYCGESENLGQLMNRTLIKNQEREMRHREKPPPLHARPLCAYQKLTLPEYRRIVNALCGYNAQDLDNSSSEGAIDTVDSPYYPTNAFKVDLSLLHAANSYAQHSQTQIASYYEIDTVRIAMRNAMPQYWFQVNPSSFMPHELHTYEFPFVEHPETCENPERTLYEQMHDYSELTTEDYPHNEVVEQIVAESMGNRKRTRVETEEDRREMFNQTLTRKTVADSILTIEKIAEKMTVDRDNVLRTKERLDQLLEQKRLEHNWDADEFEVKKADQYQDIAEMDRKATMRGLNMLRQVFHLHGPIPSALQYTADWLLRLIQEKGNFCMPLGKGTSNLTPYHEAQAREILHWENEFGVNTVHGQLSTTLMCVYAMLNGIKGVPHPGMFGPPEAGKTFTFDQLYDLLIEGTCVNLTYATAKSKTGAASDYSYRVELYQEALPEQLGVETGKSNTTGGATNNTNGESIFKTLLSESKITVQTVEIDKNTGKRRTVEHKSDCHMLIGVCSNVLVHAMPEAIRSRLLMWTMTEQHRTDNGGMAAACSKTQSHSACALVKQRVRRNQAVAALVGQLVLAKVFRPVGMDVANAIYAMLQSKARQVNMVSFDQARNRQRFMQLVRAVCIQRAIHTVFDFDPDLYSNSNAAAASGSSQGNRDQHLRVPNSHLHASQAHSTQSQYTEFGTQDEETGIYTKPKDFHRQPFEWHHLMLLERHMFVKIEDCILVFGMLVHMYEDPIFFDVVDTIKRDWFNNGTVPMFNAPAGTSCNLNCCEANLLFKSLG